MAFALIANTQETFSGSVSFVTSSAQITTGANLLIVSVFWYTGTSASMTVTDSKGNTYLPLLNLEAASRATQMFYCDNSPTVGSGHTFTATGTDCFPAICVQAWSGAVASALDQQSFNYDISGSGTTLQPGSLTPPANDSLFVTVLGARQDGGGLSINSGFTISDQIAIGGNIGSLGLAYFVQGSAGALNPTWSSPSSPILESSMATFLAAGGGGGTTYPGYQSPFGWQ